MGKVKGKIITFAALLLGAFVLLFGCGKVNFDNLKVQTEITTSDGVFNEDAEVVLNALNPDKNIFTLTVDVSGAPKEYAGEVSIDFGIDNGSIVKVGEPTFNSGKTTAQFKAVSTGEQVLVVKTLQGEVTKSVNVSVVEPISSVTFASKEVVLKAGNRVNFFDMLRFNKTSASQKVVRYDITDVEGNVNPILIQNMLTELNTTGFITFSKTEVVPNFTVVATSVINPELKTSIKVKVLDFVNEKQVALTANGTELVNNNGVFEIELAKNITDLNSALLQFDFLADNKNDYVITSANGNYDSGIISLQSVGGGFNLFRVAAISETREPVEAKFIVYNKSYIDSEYLKTEVVVRITVATYPKSIRTENEVGNAIDELTIYKNMLTSGNQNGVPFYVYAMDNSENVLGSNKMLNQKLIVSIPGGTLVEVRNSSGRLLTGDVEVTSGDVLYVKHNYDANSIADVSNIFLTITSKKYANAFKNLKLNVVKGDISLSTSKPDVDINLSPVYNVDLDGEIYDFEHGYAELEISGLPTGFNKTELKFFVSNPNLVEVITTTNHVVVKALGAVGNCVVNIAAGNGSQIQFNIKTFEELRHDNESTYITLPNGKKIYISEFSVNNGAPEVVGDATELIMQGGTNVKLNFFINGVEYSRIPAAYQVNMRSTNENVVTIQNNNELSAKSRFGSAEVEIQIRGYDVFGNFTKTITFKLVVTVEVKVETISTSLGENNTINVYSRDTIAEDNQNEFAKKQVALSLNPQGINFNEELNESFKVNIVSSYTFNKPLIVETTKDYTIYEFREIKGDIILYVQVSNLQSATKLITISGWVNSTVQSTVSLNVEFSIEQTFSNFASVGGNETITNIVKTSVKVNLMRAVLVSNLMPEVTNNVIYFDTRDFNETASNGVLDEKQIRVNIFPTNALNKKIIAKCTSEFVNVEDVQFDGNYSYLNIKLKKDSFGAMPNTDNGQPIKVTVASADSKNPDGTYGVYKELLIYINNGTRENPYQIRTENDLYRINQGMNAHYVLANDIFLSGNFMPIGLNADGNVTEFTGSLNGEFVVKTENGTTTSQNTIHNLSMKYSGEQTHYGLFASLGENAEVKNLSITNVSISYEPTFLENGSNVFIGAIAAKANGAKIENCSVSGKNSISNFNEIAFGGKNEEFGIYVNVSSTRTSSSASSPVSAINLYVGGIVGYADAQQRQTNSIVNNQVNLKIRVKENTLENSTTTVGGVAGEVVNTEVNYLNNNSLIFASNVYTEIEIINSAKNSSLPENANSAFGVGGIIGVAKNSVVQNAAVSAYVNALSSALVGGAVGYAYNTTVFNVTSMPIVSANHVAAGLVGFVKYENLNYMSVSTIGNNHVEFIHSNYSKEELNSGVSSNNIAAGLIGFVEGEEVVSNLFNNVPERADYNFSIQNNAVTGYTLCENTYGDVVTYSNLNNTLAGLIHSVNNAVVVNNQAILTLGVVETENATDNLEVAGLINKFAGSSAIVLTSANVNLKVNGNYSALNKNISAFISDATGYKVNAEIKPNNQNENGNYTDETNVIKTNDEYNFGTIEFPSIQNEDNKLVRNIDTEITSFAISNSMVNFTSNNSNFALNGSAEKMFVGVGYETEIVVSSNSEDNSNVTFEAVAITMMNSVLNMGANYNGTLLHAVGGENGRIEWVETGEYQDGEPILELVVVPAKPSHYELFEASFVDATNATTNVILSADNNLQVMNNVIYENLNNSSTGFNIGDETAVENANWYVNPNVNGGVITNFAEFKGNNIKNGVINLLTNFAPNEIVVEQTENKVNVWLMQLENDLQTVIFHYDVAAEHYLADGSINLNSYNLTEIEKINASRIIKQKLDELNTYSLTDVFSKIGCVPAFLGLNKLKITSSNNNVMQVVTLKNNEMAIKVNKSGIVTLTIFSIYNPSVTKEIIINVVSAVDKFNVYSNVSKTVNANGTTQNIVKGNTINLFTNSVNQLIISDVVLTNNIGINVSHEFTFGMKNENVGGTRFIYAENDVIYEDLSGSTLLTNTIAIEINKQKFVKHESGYYYVDVNAGEEISITGLSHGSAQVVAVPYVQTENGKLVAQDLTNFYYDSNSNNSIFNNAGTRASAINFNVINGTSNLNVNKSAITLSSFNSTTFNVTITTEEQNEMLFFSYVTASGEVVVPVNLENFTDEEMSRFNFKQNSSTSASAADLNEVNKFRGNAVVKFNNLEMYVSSIEYVNNQKVYSFVVSSTTNEEAISNIKNDVISNLTFFTAKLGSEILVDNTNSLNVNISNVQNFLQNVEVTIKPQSVISHTLLNYPNGERVVDSSTGDLTNNPDWNEVPYNNIIPSYNGILKLNVYPWYANFSYVDIVARGNGGDLLNMEQLVAVYENANNMQQITGYQVVYPENEIIENGYGIRLYKASYVNNNNYAFDGNFYIKTLIPNTAVASTAYTITVTGYAVNGSKVSVAFTNETAPLTLDVITPPEVEISVNGSNSAPIAKGTYVDIDIVKHNLDGDVTFEKSDVAAEDLQVLNDGKTLRVHCPKGTLETGTVLTIVASGKKVINNITYESTSTVELVVTNFVINNIYLTNVENGLLTGLFNQKHLLQIRIRATYDNSNSDNASFVEAQIAELENYLTYAKESNNLTQYYYLRTRNAGVVLDENINLSNSYKNFEITAGTVAGKDKMKALYLQNKVFNSKDRIVAKVKFAYSTAKAAEKAENYFGGVTVLSNGVNDAEFNFKYEFENEFGFGLHRLSNEDNPDPISEVEALMQMQAGGDYILQSDLELTNWQPLNVDINSLDGNGYVITIKSFDLSNQSESGIANIGLFAEVQANTTLKNLNVRIMPNSLGSLSNEKIPATNASSSDIYSDLDIDATAFDVVNFGIIAGVNYGTITNTNIDYVASDVVEIRENAIKTLKYENGDRDVNNAYIEAFKNSESYSPLVKPDVSLNLRRDLSVVRVRAKTTSQRVNHNMAGFVGINSGFITNSSVENVSIYGMGNLAGFVATNRGKISSSFYKGANVVNLTSSASANSATAGLVVNNDSNGEIKYSYAEGREGAYFADLGTIVNPKENEGFSKSYYISTTAEDDKTNLNKTLYSTYNLAKAFKELLDEETKTNEEHLEPNSKAIVYETLNLRAMNSAVTSNGNVASFVYTNSGLISNAYANFMVYTSGSSASGFVFENSGNISDTYSFSSIQNESQDYMPFTGAQRGSGSTVIPNNTGSIEYSQYLKLGNAVSEIEFLQENKDEFQDTNEPASSMNSTDVKEYNTYQGFAFNNDFADNNNITNAVWYIRNYEDDAKYKNNNYEESSNKSGLNALNEYKLFNNYYFKTTSKILNRPQLVAANLRTLSFRELTSTEDSAINTYNYVTYENENVSTPNFEYGSVHNPYLVNSAKNFNIFVQESSRKDKDTGGDASGDMEYKIFNRSLRFIKDIAFNNDDVTANSYNIEYTGDLDGNGMKISNVRIIADSEFESKNGKTNYLGLFGKIVSTASTGNGDTSVLGANGQIGNISAQELKITNSVITRGNVRNLHLDVDQVDGSNINLVGALAGEISNADVSNITITPMNETVVIKGRNAVGALAGVVSGNSEITNINSSVSVTASYFANSNTFTSASAANSNSKGFNIYRDVNDFDNVSNLTYTKDKDGKEIGASYAGGAIGVAILNSNNRIYSKINAKSLRNSMIRKVIVNNNVTLTAEIVGGVVGLIGEKTTASDLIFEITEGASPKINASRMAGGIAGENRGIIQRVYTTHESKWQKEIDADIQNQVNRASSGNMFVNISNQYNSLFTGNPNYMGALVGFNNAGTIRNSYARVNARNLNAMYAGGIAGLNAGGLFNTIYTTASVQSYFVMGGAVGLQLPINMPKSEDDKELITYADKNALLDSIFHQKNMYINSGFLQLPENPTNFSNVVVSSFWQESETKNTYKTDIGQNSIIGSFIGTVLAKENNGEYVLTSSVSTNVGTSRALTETNFFVQPADAGLTNPNGNVKKYNEIGSFNESRHNYFYDEVKNVADNKVEGSAYEENSNHNVVNDNGKYRSGYYEVTSITNEETTYYKYSRLFNIGSARTYKEIVGRYYNQIEANNNGDDTAPLVLGKGEKEETKRLHIYSGYSMQYWAGVSVENGVVPQTDNSVFPYLTFRPELGRILVYNEQDLRSMNDNLFAEFILMNDITVSGSWTSVGTSSEPFSGELHSYGNNVFTITFEGPIVNKDNAYGLVGYANNANFYDFNISNATISAGDDESASSVGYHIGAVVGIANNSSEDFTILNNVSVYNSVIEGSNVISMGGLVGTGLNTYITNCSFETNKNFKPENVSSNIVLNSAFKNNTSEEQDVISIGGLAGRLQGFNKNMESNANVVASGIMNSNKDKDVTPAANVSNVTITVGDNATNNKDFILNIGGAIGTIDSNLTATSELKNALTLQGVSTKNVNINTANLGSAKTVSVGGLVGYANCANFEILTNYEENGHVTNISNKVEGLNFNEGKTIERNVLQEFNIGGAIGKNKNSYGGNIILGTANKLNVEFGSDVNTLLKATVGGVFGYADVNTLENIAAANLKINVAGAPTATIGGFAGYLNVAKSSEFNEAEKSVEIAVSNCATAKVGGFAGELNGYVKKSAAAARLQTSACTTLTVGGFAAINNANITESLSNSLIEIKETNSGSGNNFVAGGFVGKNNNKIENCYSTGTIAASTKNIKLGGFAGENTTENNILNSYTISKIVILNSNNVNDYANMQNVTTVNPFVGSGTVAASNMFNEDLVLYGNANGATPLTYNKMLLNGEVALTFNKGEIWNTNNNKYPTFVNPFFSSYQEIGSNQCPSTGNTFNAEFDAYIINSGNINIFQNVETNATLYYESGVFGSLKTLGTYGMLVGVEQLNATAEYVVENNNGVITGANIAKANKFVNVNNGVIFNTKINFALDENGFIKPVNSENNIANGFININNGAIVKLSVVTYKSTGVNYLVTNNFGFINEVAIHTNNNSTQFNVVETNSGNVFNSYTENAIYELDNYYRYYYNTNGVGAEFSNEIDITMFTSDSGYTLDFENGTWVMFGAKTTINGGAPVLTFELKDRWNNPDIKDVYYWENFTEEIRTTNGNIEISNVEQFAYFAKNVSKFNNSVIRIIKSLDFSKNKNGAYVNRLFTPVGRTKNSSAITEFSGTLIGFVDPQNNRETLAMMEAYDANSGNIAATLSNIMVLTKGNAALLDTVANTCNLHNLKIQNSTFANTKNNESAGAYASTFVGKVKAVTSGTTPNFVADQLASENNSVVSCGTAAALIGEMNGGTIMDSYSSFGNVKSFTNNAHAFNSVGNNNKIQTSYFSSNLIGGTTFANNATVENCYYLTGCGITTGNGATAKNEYAFRVERFDGFNWGEIWGRSGKINSNFPAHLGAVTAWIGYTEMPQVSGNTYYITKPEHLAWIAKMAYDGRTFNNETVVLNADIDLGDRLWTPIGMYLDSGDNTYVGLPFKGTFDFNGHTVYNVNVYAYYITGDCQYFYEEAALGFFGYLENATVKNSEPDAGAALRNVAVYGGNKLAALAGVARSSTITNIYFDNVDNNYIYVNGNNNVGGLVGYTVSGVVINGEESKARNAEAIINSAVIGNENVGGVVGYAYSNVSISKTLKFLDNREYTGAGNYVNTLNVTGVKNVGGVVGCAGEVELYNAANVASVTGSYNVGGVVGYTTATYSSKKSVIDNTDYFTDIDTELPANAGTINAVNPETPTGEDYYIGGLIGYAEGNVFINGALNEGDINVSISNINNNVYPAGAVGYNNGGYISQVINNANIANSSYEYRASFIGNFVKGVLDTAQDKYSASDMNININGGSNEDNDDYTGSTDTKVIKSIKRRSSGQATHAFENGSLWVGSDSEYNLKYAQSWNRKSNRINYISDGLFYGFRNGTNNLIKENVTLEVKNNSALAYVANYVASSELNINRKINVRLLPNAGAALSNAEMTRAIGNYYYPYIGTFEGDNYLGNISTINITKLFTGANSKYASTVYKTQTGLFGVVGLANDSSRSTKVQNLILNVTSSLTFNSTTGSNSNVAPQALFISHARNSEISDITTRGSELNLQTQGGFGTIGLLDNSRLTGDGTTKTTFAVNVNASGSSYVGGVVGIAYNNSEISYVRNIGNIIGSNSSKAGIVAQLLSGGSVKQVENTGKVEGYSNLGGIVGYNTGIIENATNSGAIKGTEQVGGIVGSSFNRIGTLGTNETTKSIKNTGAISGTSRIGGIVGCINYESNSGVSKDKVICINATNSGSISGSNYIGGIVGLGGTYRNVKDSYIIIENCTNSGVITGKTNDGASDVGGIAGQSYYGIKNCANNSNGKVTGKESVGGIVGAACESDFISCTNYATVSGTNKIGGVTGYLRLANIIDCSNEGNITGSSNYVGGIVGTTSGNAGNVYSSSNTNRAYNKGSISGNQYVGGIVGNASKVEYYNNTGAITASNIAGGIAGECNNISNSKNTANITAKNAYEFNNPFNIYFSYNTGYWLTGHFNVSSGGGWPGNGKYKLYKNKNSGASKIVDKSHGLEPTATSHSDGSKADGYLSTNYTFYFGTIVGNSTSSTIPGTENTGSINGDLYAYTRIRVYIYAELMADSGGRYYINAKVGGDKYKVTATNSMGYNSSYRTTISKDSYSFGSRVEEDKRCGAMYVTTRKDWFEGPNLECMYLKRTAYNKLEIIFTNPGNGSKANDYSYWYI